MSDNNRDTLRAVAWSEILPWLVIFRTFRLAIAPRVLILAAVAILLMLSGWAALGLVFSVDAEWMKPENGCPWLAIDKAVSPFHGLPDMEDLAKATQPMTATGMPGNPFYGTWVHLSQPLWEVARGDVTLPKLACLLLCGLWAVAVWALFGGAITRIAAVQLTCEEQVGWAAALRHARSKWLSYFAAPLLPLTGVALAALPVALLGLLLREAYVGAWLAALLWPLALLAGLVMAILLLGLAFGWPLMWSTIGTEGTDSFDALSRSYAYLFGRPLHYLFYAAVAALLGALGWLLVSNFAAGVIWATYWAASWGAGPEKIAMIRAGELGMVGRLIDVIWIGCVKLLAVGFIFSYFWTASTAIYLLLRRDVDATEMDEVFLDEDASEPTYGLSPLKTDEAGAPVVDDDVPEVEPDEARGPEGEAGDEPQD